MLLGPSGKPISTYKKETPHAFGPGFGLWQEQDRKWNQLPGGAVLQFNLDNLTLTDYRAMRYHPTINLSLCVVTFMLHQIDWHIEAENTRIASKVDEIIRPVWTRLIRAMSQAFWAGYSPITIEYENNISERRVDISKIKDLVPEDCRIHWKDVEGSYAPDGKKPPKFKVYDGIDQWGVGFPWPAENTIWYPLLMENGDMTGRKLLKACFMPWYFSTLIHLFANRYYERFGEPMPIGRAPFEDEFPIKDSSDFITGKEAMEMILLNLRNRSVVTLPSTRDSDGNFDYDISYLESQMRGADFERYLTRLDEEMSLGLFTPILLYRTGSVGSNSLGVQHTRTWLWMLNALAADLKEYIDRYLLDRLRVYNFGVGTKPIQWIPHRMGRENTDTIRGIVQALIQKDKIKPDVDELGQALGMTLEEIDLVTSDNPDNPSDAPRNSNPSKDDRVRVRPDSKTKGKGIPPTSNRLAEVRATIREINSRVRLQVDKAWRENRFDGNFKISMGYRKRFVSSLVAEGFSSEAAENFTQMFYSYVDNWVADAVSVGSDEFTSSSDFVALFERFLDNLVDDVYVKAA